MLNPAIAILVTLAATGAEAAEPAEGTTLQILYHSDPRFLAGLEKHSLLGNHGFRLLNTGFVATPFGERWRESPELAKARASGRPYYIDRITGGMPFQSLEGIEEIAAQLKDDPRFLGFQVHEWGGSPFHDHRRIREHLLGKGYPLDAEHFARLEGRTSLPFFSGGDYAMYHDLYRPLETKQDAEQYLEAYFTRLLRITDGQVMAVNGYKQLYHTALRLGAKNVMAEIGNQVPLAALQIACVRGAAREHGKPFGVYYETWGGTPFGCTCATDFSPWFATQEQLQAFHEMGSVGPQFGSSRSLQRRLLFFAWLSGAAYWAEEWGAENYFANWDDFPLTEYGRIMKDFVEIAAKQGPLTPVVPAAIVLPAGTFGIDNGFVAGHADSIYGIAPADTCHRLLRTFASQVFATQPSRKGGDAQNLTPSPWIGSFDVLSADASAELLSRYPVLVFFDSDQAKAAAATGSRVHVFDGQAAATAAILNDVRESLPVCVEGEVGCVQARINDGLLVGLLNNHGITKTAQGETKDPAATRAVTVSGPCSGLSAVYGAETIRRSDDHSVQLELPAGDVAILSFRKAESK